MFDEVNLELNHPTVKVAMDRLKQKLNSAKAGDCLLLIHGYGSTGKGGEIKKEVVDYLYKLQKAKKIKSVIPGEEFSITTGIGYNYEAIRLRTKHKELESYAFQRNRGVTVIEI